MSKNHTPPSRRARAGRVALAITAAAVLGPLAGLASASGNDYPWKHDTSRTSDGYGFEKRQCVSFVAWRERQVHHLTLEGAQWGDATHWDAEAAALHYTVSRLPVVGAVAQWHAHEVRHYAYVSGRQMHTGTTSAGGAGHVAIVTRVFADGTVSMEMYNGENEDRNYDIYARAAAPRYLYLDVK